MRKYTFQRTVSTSIVTYIMFDKATKATSLETLKVQGRYHKDDKKLLSVARKQLENDTYKVLMIDSIEYEEKLYGMTLEDFLKYATPLDKDNTD